MYIYICTYIYLLYVYYVYTFHAPPSFLSAPTAVPCSSAEPYRKAATALSAAICDSHSTNAIAYLCAEV